MSDELSDEETFGRRLESIPLDDMIYELKARLKEGSDAWPALLTTVQEYIVGAASADEQQNGQTSGVKTISDQND